MHFKREKPDVRVINGRLPVGKGSALVKKIEGPDLPSREPRRSGDVAKEATAEGERVYALDPTAEACAVRACM